MRPVLEALEFAHTVRDGLIDAEPVWLAQEGYVVVVNRAARALREQLAVHLAAQSFHARTLLVQAAALVWHQALTYLKGYCVTLGRESDFDSHMLEWKVCARLAKALLALPIGECQTGKCRLEGEGCLAG